MRKFYPLDYIWNSSNKRRTGTAALIREPRLLTFLARNAALIRGRCLFEGGAYSRAVLIRGRRLIDKYGIYLVRVSSFVIFTSCENVSKQSFLGPT